MWKGNTYPKTFLEEIFIDDTDNIELKDKCSIELNFDALDSLTVRDSSGKNNKGLVIGDYSVSKPNKQVEVFKDTRMITPLIEEDKNDGAI